MANSDKEDFLQASIEDGAWRRARKLVKSVDKASARLDDESDLEALHDFRVALRQLRTFVRAYDDYLPISKKFRKALRTLARNTNEARDLEVLVELLNAEKKLPALANNIAIDLLTERLNARLLKLYEPLRDLEARQWKALRKSLIRHINTVRLKADSGYSFLEVTRNRIDEQADTLEQELSGLANTSDDHLSHETRITGKRLRYLIEPLRSDFPRAVDVVSELKIIQDALGDYHDAFVLLQHIESSLYDLYGQHAQQLVRKAIEGEEVPSMRDPLADCLKLVQVIKEQRKSLWNRFYRRYVTDRNLFISEVQALAAELAGHSPETDSEPVGDATIFDIEQYRKAP